MSTWNRTFVIARHSLTLSALLGCGLIVAQAQQTAVPAASQEPKLNLALPAPSQEAMFSSSADNQDVVAENHFDFVAAAKDAAQPPTRGSYGRPRYRDSNTNADGSNKWTFMAGAGFSSPMSNTANVANTGWGLQVGGGRNFSQTLGLLLDFSYDRLGFNNGTLNNQLALYNQIIAYYNQTSAGIANPASSLSGLDGNTHLYSLSLDPIFNFHTSDSVGAYVTGGVGFYHKVADFTTPTVGTYYDPYYGYYQAQANQLVDHYFSNGIGVNGGVGMTYKMSRFSSERLYAEARVVYIPFSQRNGITLATVNGSNYLTANDFPANSNHTVYVPVKVGIRF